MVTHLSIILKIPSYLIGLLSEMFDFKVQR